MWISRYWIKLPSLWQDASCRKLALALGISLILHLFLIGQFNFNFSGFKQPRDLIEVRLVPKAEPNTAQKLVASEKPVVKPVETKKREIVAKPEETNQTKAEPESPASEPLEQTEIASVIEPVTIVPITATPSEGILPVDKPKPYQYVESDFDVYTDKDTELNRTPVGKANIVYQLMPNGQQYKLRSLIQAKGLVSLVIPDLLQTSDGYLDEMGLQPQHYLYQFGDKKDKTYKADFDWESKKLTLRSEQGEEKLDLKEGTQDLLSFMYQFMFVPPLQNMQLSITNGKKLGVYDYVFVGEELIATSMGNLNTYHIERMAEEGEKKTELWLALDYQHVPVKIRETDKQGKVYELVITNLIARVEPLPVP